MRTVGWPGTLAKLCNKTHGHMCFKMELKQWHVKSFKWKCTCWRNKACGCINPLQLNAPLISPATRRRCQFGVYCRASTDVELNWSRPTRHNQGCIADGWAKTHHRIPSPFSNAPFIVYAFLCVQFSLPTCSKHFSRKYRARPWRFPTLCGNYTSSVNAFSKKQFRNLHRNAPGRQESERHECKLIKYYLAYLSRYPP